MHTPLPEATDARLRDADLTRLLAQGDRAGAFEGLVARYATKVFHLCSSLLNDTVAAEDATQECLLRAWRGLGGYQADRAALSTWLYAVTRNHCFTLLQAQRPASLSTSLPDIQALVEAIPAPAATGPDQATQTLLHRLVRALPPAQRQCIQLFYFEDRSVADVAEMLALPDGTVKTHLHRARAALAKSLAAAGHHGYAA